MAHSRLREAFVVLDRVALGEQISVTLEPALRMRVARVVRRKRRRQFAMNLLSRSYHSPLGAPLQAALTRIVPRK